MSNNRGLTLAGANKIFSAVGIQFEEIPTGGYRTLTGDRQAKTLTELCRQILVNLTESANL